METKTTVSSIFFALMWLGCQSPVPQNPLDLNRLMQQGNCQQIEKELQQTTLSASTRGALAACSLTHANPTSSKQAALQYLVNNNSSQKEIAAQSMLHFAALHPTPSSAYIESVFEISFAISGYGPSAISAMNSQNSHSSQQLVVDILKFLRASCLDSNRTACGELISEVWNGCLQMLNGSFVGATDYLAWQLYTNFAAVALSIWDPMNKTDLAVGMMQATIAIVENNPPISVAARCDLSAPYEKLKNALSKNISLLGRFERAVSAATGCTRGRYAPQP